MRRYLAVTETFKNAHITSKLFLSDPFVTGSKPLKFGELWSNSFCVRGTRFCKSYVAMLVVLVNVDQM